MSMGFRRILFCLIALMVMACGPLPASAAPGGATIEPEKVAFQSATLGKEVSLYVFKPQGFQPEKHYPVLYLLHGEGGTYTDWATKTQLASYLTAYDMMVVTPEGGAKGWYIDSPVVEASKYATFAAKELPQYIDSHFPTLSTKAGRAISGYSMGGHGALTLAMKYSDVFGSVSSLGAIADITRLPDSKDLKAILGPSDKSRGNWVANSAMKMALAGKMPADMPIYMACGADDANLQQNRDMHEALRMAGVPNSFVEHPGKHDWKFCDARLSEILLFHAKQFRKGQPLPAAVSPDLTTYPSVALKGETKFYVLKPADFDASKRYPVLYLLHGAYGQYPDWYKNTGLASYIADKDMIVVLTDGSFMPAYIDSPILPNSQYETFLTQELVAYIDGHYPTIALPGARGIAGLSMGGHGAITLAMKHPDIYGSASSLSGIVDINRHGLDWEIEKKLGTKKKDPDIWIANSALQRTLDKLMPKGLAVFTSVGVDDFAYPENRDFHQAMMLRGVPHSYVEHPGAHTWEYWDGHIEEHLLFHAVNFAPAVAQARAAAATVAP